MAKNDVILANSFDAPKTSPVAYVMLNLTEMAIIKPPNMPPTIPIIPVKFRAVNPIMVVIMVIKTNLGKFMASIKCRPVPLPIGVDMRQQPTKPIFADISEINKTKMILIKGNDEIENMLATVIRATIKNRAIPPVPILKSRIISIFFSGVPCAINASPKSINPSKWWKPVKNMAKL